jgi:hypothetical protein
MNPKETKEYVLLMMIRTMIAKMSPEISKHWRPTMKVLQEDAQVVRIKNAPAEAVTFASALSDLFVEMARKMSEAENLQTVAQLMAYLRSARDGEVGIVEETATSALVAFPLHENTPMPEGLKDVYIWDDQERDWWKFTNEVPDRETIQVNWDYYRKRIEMTHWTRLPPPTVTTEVQ